jgi:NAD(P)-dependent dehydrogenase (short-subunit alcohol dehydrogenase family)
MVTRGDSDGQRPYRFTDARVVVTGGAQGIGREIVTAFAAEGARVAVLDRLVDEAQSVAGETGGISVQCDLEDAASTTAAMDTAIGELGGIDVLVNNAGVFRITPLLDISPDEWDWIFAVNVRAMLLTIQVAARTMIAQGGGGKIVNMASMGGKVGAPGQAHYAASKAAVISLTQVSAGELGGHGITVNSICPGYVLTDMGAAGRTPEMVAEWTAKSPLGRLGRPADVAAMALFLASGDADYCTGQALNVTGGMIMH